MLRICSLVQKRINIDLNKKTTLVHKSTNITLDKNSTLVQKLHEIGRTSAETAYHRTSLSFKHKEKGSNSIFSSQDLFDYNDYCGWIKSTIRLGLLEKDTTPLNIADWFNSGKPKKHLQCLNKNC